MDIAEELFRAMQQRAAKLPSTQQAWVEGPEYLIGCSFEDGKPVWRAVYDAMGRNSTRLSNKEAIAALGNIGTKRDLERIKYE